jgi:hypothetical protein
MKKLVFLVRLLGIIIASLSLILYRKVESPFYDFFIIPIVIGYSLGFGLWDKMLGEEE